MRLPKLRLLLCCGLLAGLSLLPAGSSKVAAQPPADDEPAVAPVPASAEKPAPLWDRLIYLPYKNLKNVFEKGDATVLIPYLEYLSLKEKSEAMRAEGPPVSAVVSESHYSAKIEQDLVRIKAALSVQVLDKPWAEVPVAFGDAAVGKISSGDGQALLRGTGQGTYSLLLPTKGTHNVELELVAQVHTSPDGRSFRFECPPVGITTFELVIPEADQTVELTPQRVALPVKLAADGADAAADDSTGLSESGSVDEVGGGETRVKSSLGSTSSISARWYPRAGLKPDMDLLASVTNALSVSVADGLVHTSATLQYNVLRGQIAQLRIAVPLGHRILDVSAPGAKVKGWKKVDEANRQLITVELLSPVRDAIAVEVHTERTLPDGPFDVAGVLEDGTVSGIHAVDAVRENGLLVVSYGSDVSLSVVDGQGLIRVDAADVPNQRRRAGALYYKFYSPRFRLSVSASPVEPRIVAQQTTQLTFSDDELKLESRLSFDVERAGVFELQVQLPAGLTVEGVAVEGMKEYAVDADTRMLSVSLLEKRLGAVELTVTGHREFDPAAGEENQLLPLLEPLGVARETGSVYVYAPPSIEVVTDAETVSGAYPEPLSSPRAATRGLRGRGLATIVSAWTYSRRPVEIPFRTRRKPTRLTADVATTVDVGQQLVRVVTRLEYNVEFAGIDTFRFQVPAAYSESVQIESAAASDQRAVGAPPGIKQRLPAEAAVDGWITWTVVMQQEITGRQAFQVTYDIQRDAETAGDDEGEEAATPRASVPDTRSVRDTVTVEPLRALGLEAAAGRPAVTLSAIAGEVVILKDRALAVSAEATGGDVEPIDVRELRLAGLSRDGFLAYLYHKQPVKLALTTEKHDIQEVVETVIPKALVEIVIGRDRMATYRCRYRVISSERQRLAVDLPTDFEPLGVLVDGMPVTLGKNGGGEPDSESPVPSPADGEGAQFVRRFVNVARRTASDQAFYLTLLFRAPVVDGNFAGGRGGREALPLPRIGGEATSAVAVQQLRTALWVPEEYALVGRPENFVLQTRARLGAGGHRSDGSPSGPESGSLLWGPLTGDKQTDELERWIGGGLGGSADFPTEGHAFRYSSLTGADQINVTFYRMSYLAWFLSLTVLLVAGLLLRTGWENKLGFLLLAGFAAALLALANSDWVFHGLVAARFGIAAMLGWWLIHALASDRRHEPVTPAAPPASPIFGPTTAVIPPPGVFEQLVMNRGPSEAQG